MTRDGTPGLVAADNPILRKRAKEAVGSTVEIAETLARVMREHNGLGLAAPQIGASVRVAVLRDAPFILVNPLIMRRSPETEVQDEACLSLPGVTMAVRRHLWITVWSELREHRLEGLVARVAQHEIDHLDGVMITDRGEARPALTVERSEGAHPEDYCDRCGRPNVVWFAPNELWNRAVPEGGILCPVCFVQAAERVGINQAAWKLAPEELPRLAGPAQEGPQ